MVFLETFLTIYNVIEDCPKSPNNTVLKMYNPFNISWISYAQNTRL